MDILAIISIILFCIAVWLGWNLKSSKQIRSLYASLVPSPSLGLTMEKISAWGPTPTPKENILSLPLDTLFLEEGILSPNELRGPLPGTPFEKEVVFTGKIKLPSKVYEDDTYIVKINMTPNLQMERRRRTFFRFNYEPKSGAISLKVNAEGMRQSMKLEISLVGVGCEVKALQPEVQELRSECLTYSWGCSFPSSGHKMLIVKLQAYLKSGEKLSDSSFQIDHRVKVVRVDHLTKRQVWLLAWLTGGASFIMATVTSLDKIVGVL